MLNHAKYFSQVEFLFIKNMNTVTISIARFKQLEEQETAINELTNNSNCVIRIYDLKLVVIGESEALEEVNKKIIDLKNTVDTLVKSRDQAIRDSDYMSVKIHKLRYRGLIERIINED